MVYILTLLCPCNNISTGTTVPSFVGNDHYCESGLPAGQILGISLFVIPEFLFLMCRYYLKMII